MNVNGFEIERKYLIAMPNVAQLERLKTRKLDIVQVYLLSRGVESARIRKITENGAVTYIKTVKEHVSSIKRIEKETAISEAEYTSLLDRADPARRPIEKVRYCVPHDGHIFEIDIFPFWKEQAFLEIELSHETEAFTLPPFITVLREVTDDRRYTNASLAKQIPDK